MPGTRQWLPELYCRLYEKQFVSFEEVYLLGIMSRYAVRSLGDARGPQPVPDEVWDKYQAIKKEHARGTAAWRKQWEVVHYREGDIRDGKPLQEGAVYYRHIACRAEYGTSNLPRTHKEHNCEKVCGDALHLHAMADMQVCHVQMCPCEGFAGFTGKGTCCSS